VSVKLWQVQSDPGTIIKQALNYNYLAVRVRVISYGTLVGQLLIGSVIVSSATKRYRSYQWSLFI